MVPPDDSRNDADDDGPGPDPPEDHGGGSDRHREPGGSPRDPDDGGGSPPGSTPDGGSPPNPEPGVADEDDRGPVEAFVHSDDPVVATVREILSSVAMVAAIGLVLFAISGVWPPLVAVESGSMEPHMHKGDLVFVVEPGRLSPGGGADAAVVTYREGRESGYESFGTYGNVVVYRPDGRGGTPIIHRAMFYVEEGEDWVAMANESYLGHVSDCRQVTSCPAKHDGYITKGDYNDAYDQVAGRSTVVKREWIRGTAKVRVPLLGCVRLQLSGDSCF